MSRQSQAQEGVQGGEFGSKKLEKKLSATKKEVYNLQQALTRKNRKMKEANRLLADPRKAVQQLEHRLRNAEDERSSLVETVRQLESELADYKTQCDTISSQKEEALVLRREETGMLRQNLKKMIEMQMKLKEAEKAANDMKAENDQVVADYEQKLQSVSVALASSERELKQARDRTEKLESEIADHLENLAQMQEKTAVLEGKLSKIERQQVNLEQRNKELEKKVEENEELLEKIAEIQEEEKLALIEAKTATEKEHKQLMKVLETKEAEMKDTQGSNVEASAHQSESAIQKYKEAVQKVDNVTKKYEELLSKRNQELGQHQTNLQALRETAEKAEKKFLAEQRKNQQMQKELEQKTEGNEAHGSTVVQEFGPVINAAAEKIKLRKFTMKSKKEYTLPPSATGQVAVNWFSEKVWDLLQDACEHAHSIEHGEVNEATRWFFLSLESRYEPLVVGMITEIFEG